MERPREYGKEGWCQRGRGQIRLTEVGNGLEGDDGDARAVDDLHVRRDVCAAHERSQLEQGALPCLVIEGGRRGDHKVRVAADGKRQGEVAGQVSAKGYPAREQNKGRTRREDRGPARRSRTCRRCSWGTAAARPQRPAQ